MFGRSIHFRSIGPFRSGPVELNPEATQRNAANCSRARALFYPIGIYTTFRVDPLVHPHGELVVGLW